MLRTGSVRLFLSVLAWLLVASCMKDDQNDPRALDLLTHAAPTVTTKTVTNVTQVSALCGGRVVSDGGSPVIAYGVCWSKLPGPTINDHTTFDGAGVENYTSLVENLEVGTTYYLRAFAKNNFGVGYGGEQMFKTEDMLEIGIKYEGGLIFYLDATGTHGLVCAEEDQSTSCIWGCANVQVNGADGTSLGTGNANTHEILNSCHASGIAAGICVALDQEGYQDWFLPSKDELKLMYNNLHLAHLGNFSNLAYWSSTEMTSVFAWQIAFNSGIVQGASKTTPSAVRAIRAF